MRWPFVIVLTVHGLIHLMGEYDGYRLSGYGEARWQLPEGDFTYGEFALRDVAYNVAQ